MGCGWQLGSACSSGSGLQRTGPALVLVLLSGLLWRLKFMRWRELAVVEFGGLNVEGPGGVMVSGLLAETDLCRSFGSWGRWSFTGFRSF